MKQGTINLFLITGALASVVYLFSKVAPIVSKATSAVATGAANIWVSLTSSGPVNVLGNVTLPNGNVVPISSLSWKQDNQGNSYTMISGSLYQMAPRDAAGNFTLTLTANP